VNATELIERGRDGRLPSDARQAATIIVDALLCDELLGETAVFEATVHLPKRGKIYLATFTGPAGGQVWRTTGLSDRRQALTLAKRWEAQARAQRLKMGRSPR
jgi:hypothetical protein